MRGFYNFHSFQAFSWKSVFLILILLFCIPKVQAQGLSGSFTVCASGCDYSTVGKALNDLKAKGMSGGVSLQLTDKSYNENISVPSINGLSESNTLTISGSGRYSTRIYGTGGSYGGVVEIRNLTPVHLENLTIENTSALSGKYAVYLYYAENITVRHCIVQASLITTSSGNSAIYNYFGKGSLFRNNIIRGGYSGVCQCHS